MVTLTVRLRLRLGYLGRDGCNLSGGGQGVTRRDVGGMRRKVAKVVFGLWFERKMRAGEVDLSLHVPVDSTRMTHATNQAMTSFLS